MRSFLKIKFNKLFFLNIEIKNKHIWLIRKRRKMENGKRMKTIFCYTQNQTKDQ